MELTAQKVLKDCEAASYRLVIENDFQTFRLIWISAISLIRAVGHVLHKVDSKRSEELADGINELYKSWKSDRNKHKIFWEFIEAERNNVLKEYEIGFLGEPVTIHVVDTEESYTVDWKLYCPLSSGEYVNEDCRCVLDDAIQWWKEQINELPKYT